MASVPINSWQTAGEKKNGNRLSWASKSLQTGTEAIKLKDTCSLEGKL